jgi:hypothetical protein
MMVYNNHAGLVVSKVQKYKKQLALASAAILTASFAAMTLSASALTVQGGCNFDDTTPGAWVLQGDCASTSQINVPAGTTLDGAGHTISPSFTKTDNSNNAVIGVISANGVTIKNLTIDGTNGTDLHGINVYQSQNVLITDVTSKNNDHSGISVNASTVEVKNVTTSGNGWHGINVDKQGAVLNITGPMHQTDAAQLYVDDSTLVTVNDVLGQYKVTSPEGGLPNDQLYTLKTVLGSKEACKNGGWATSEAPAFKNQGQCVSYFASNGKH